MSFFKPAHDSGFRPVYLKIPPSNIAELKFLLESYEGLGEMRTLDGERGEVMILAVEGTAAELSAFLDSVAERLELRRVASLPSAAQEEGLKP